MQLDKLTAGQKDFLDQYTRKCLAEWCAGAIQTDGFVPAAGNPQIVLQYAITKKWLSQDYKILSAGWDTATRFLKR